MMRYVWVFAAAGIMLGSAMGLQAEPAGENEQPAFQLTSPAFEDGQAIPARHAMKPDGQNVSPELKWDGVPAGTKEFAMIVDDPDAPSPRRPGPKPWVHWVAYRISVNLTSMPEDAGAADRLAVAALCVHGKNSSGVLGYTGPLPPKGSGRHRYVFTLYALDRTLELPAGATKDELLQAMEGHILGQAKLVGTYERK
jgi:Raf kinase inhibitor-like YbhB/YbcL family protein